MIEILPIGEMMKTDAQGFFINESSVDKIVSPWKEVVEEMIRVYRDHLEDVLVSVYVRGTVSRGQAAPGVSDLDTFAIIKTDPALLDLSWIETERRRLEQKYPFASGVEFEIKSLDDLMSGKKYFHEMCISSMAALVYGEDLASRLHHFKPDLELAKRFHGDIEKRINEIREQINQTDNSGEIRLWCSWIMKRIVRTGCALRIQRTNQYTRDLYPGYELFSKYYPEKSEEMRTALALAINPTDNKNTIYTVLDGLGAWMVHEVKTLWK